MTPRSQYRQRNVLDRLRLGIKLALAIHHRARPLSPEISSDRQSRPRADARCCTRGIRTSGCQRLMGRARCSPALLRFDMQGKVVVGLASVSPQLTEALPNAQSPAFADKAADAPSCRTATAASWSILLSFQKVIVSECDCNRSHAGVRPHEIGIGEVIAAGARTPGWDRFAAASW